MRSYTEPSCRHLLRQPLICGIPMSGMLVLSTGTVLGQALARGNPVYSCIGLGTSALGYCTLRLFTQFAKAGWDQSLLFLLERAFASKKGGIGKIEEVASDVEVTSPDTIDDSGLLNSKQIFEDDLKHLRPEELYTLRCIVDESGARIQRLALRESCARIRKKADLSVIPFRFTGIENPHVYSLYQVPVSTDPLWFFPHLKDLTQNYQVIASFRGAEQSKIKTRIESYRRLNSQLSDSDEVDLDISYEDASHVLRGLSRGDDCVLEMSLVIASDQELPLDTNYFFKEKSIALSLLSVLGLRPRFHRGHYVRLVTATDLIPHILDPLEEGTAMLKTLRGKPLYFDPQDPRLDALHWLVCGATGTGKSFFVGLVLLRMIQAGRPISVLFIDHKRSFKRLVVSTQGRYIEPGLLSELKSSLRGVFEQLDLPGTLSGVELSDLPYADKKDAASYVLRQISEFLGRRNSEHVLYIVMDECWKFLKHDPQAVQEAFREFRKFDAAAVAITQSIKDFISDEAGQSIIQNADISVLLRQKEDITRFQDVLDLSEPEMAKVKQIKKRKGIYSECLIKTPFLSRFGRLYPTETEHELLRTDNLRLERVAQAKLHKTDARGECAELF